MALNEIAKQHYDDAVDYLVKADAVDDVNSSLCFTGMGQLSIELARFASENPALVAGIDPYQPPTPEQMAVPAGPTTGPRFWGAPQT